jgi:hypothetical protein
MTTRHRLSISGGLLTLAAVCLSPSPAQADDESPYCRAVEARATGDASLLMTPKLIGQGYRIPGADQSSSSPGSMTPIGATNGSFEARAGAGWSPTDFYKGVQTMALGRRDCAQHEAEASVDRLLAQAEDAGRLPALRKQAAFLDAHHTEWQDIAKKEQDRFNARVISVVDLNSVLVRIVGLEKTLAMAHGEGDRLEARAFTRPPASLGAMEENVLARENEYEAKFSHVRTLSAFNALVVGGAEFAQETSSTTMGTSTTTTTSFGVGWYGVVELTFNLGFFLEYGKEGTYLNARAEELKNARYERAWRLRSFQKELEAARKEAQSELDIVERQLTAISTTRRTLEVAETPNVLHAIASLKVDEISAGSDQTYLHALLDELTYYLTPDKPHAP